MAAAPPPTTSAAPRPLTPRAMAFSFLLNALWGGNAVAIKAGLDDAPPLRLAWMRFLVGGIVTIAWARSTGLPMRPERRELRALGWLGAIFVAQIACMNIGQDHTTASHAVVINTTFPLWAGVLAHVFVPGDRLSPLRTAGTLIAYGGIVVVFAQSLGEGGQLLGDVLMLGSAALLAGRLIYTSRAAQGIALPKLLLTQTVVGVAAFAVTGLALEREPWVITDRLVLSIAYQGLVIAGFGFIGQTWLLKHFLPSAVTAIALTTPVWGVLLSNLVLGEALSASLFAGLALVIAGSALTQWGARRQAA